MNRESGFTLIEVCIALVVSIVLLFALHASTRASVKTRETIEHQYELHLLGLDYIERLRRIPFGTGGSAQPPASWIDELFDDDTDLGPITLNHLAVAPGARGYRFTTATQSGSANWEVLVTNDLNGDGDAGDPREGRTDLYSVTLYSNGRVLFETVREAEPFGTTPDN